MSTRDAPSKDAAVARVRAGERVSVVAADVGVHPSTIRRWVKAAEATEPPPAAHEPDPFMAALLLPRRPEPFTTHQVDLEPVELEPVTLDPVELEPFTLFPEADALAADRRRGDEDASTTSEQTADPDREPSEDEADDDTDRERVGDDQEPAEESALEQLQALATAPGDAIIRFGQRLPMLERYLIVVTAWVVCVVIGGIAPDSHPGRGVLVALHLLAMTVAFGSVMALDWHGILWERRQRAISESIRLSHALSPLIWSGLAVLFVTGALLAPDLTSVLTWLKLVSVLVLALNGVATSQLRRHLVSGTDEGLRSLPLGPRSRVLFSSVLSQVCWLTAVLIGLATTMSR